MKLYQEYQSPNIDPVEIPVEFLVLHYTAGDLESTLDLFLDSVQQLSSHLVLDDDGVVYELVPCWQGSTQRAWHAGRSHWVEGQVKWTEFNNFSIGIEIVNLNGNLFPYTEAQYAALQQIIAHLRAKYPALNDPNRVIGHEHIAGWRGKVDPGFYFDWGRFYQENFFGLAHPVRENRCHPELADSFSRFVGAFPDGEGRPDRYWHAVSHAMETSSRLIQPRAETDKELK